MNNRIRLALPGLAAVAFVACAYIGAGDPATPSPPITPTSAVTVAALPTTAETNAGYVPPDEAEQLLRTCGLTGRVAAYFRVPDDAAIWDHFPKLGLAPEIEDEGGLFVAVYDGPVEGAFTGGPVVNVLCVVTSDMVPNVYANVSRDGMVLPPGTHVAGPDEWLLPTPQH